MKKIRETTAKKRTNAPGAKVGLLQGHTDEVYTDGLGAEIEMEEEGSAAAPPAPTPVALQASSPSKSAAPAAVNKGSETQPAAMVEVVANQFDIPESVKAKWVIMLHVLFVWAKVMLVVNSSYNFFIKLKIMLERHLHF